MFMLDFLCFLIAFFPLFSIESISRPFCSRIALKDSNMRHWKFSSFFFLQSEKLVSSTTLVHGVCILFCVHWPHHRHLNYHPVSGCHKSCVKRAIAFQSPRWFHLLALDKGTQQSYSINYHSVGLLIVYLSSGRQKLKGF